MTFKYGPSLQSGAYTYGRGSLGIPAELVPSTGLDGPAYFYGSLDMPGDTGSEISAHITRYPTNGTLSLVGDDGAFSYTGATDYLLYELREWDVLDATDIGYGPGIGRVDLAVGAAVDLAPAAATVTVAGHAPTVAQPTMVAPAAQQIAIAGGVPSISQPQSLSPAAQQIIVVGGVPSIGQSEAFAPDAQQIIVVGGVPTIGQPQSLSPGAQQITVYGWAPLLSQVEGPPPVADPIRLLAIISQEIAFEATIEQA